MILISACLAGVNCKYNGSHNLNPIGKQLVAEGRALPVCPEQLGGLPTPRRPAEIRGGDGRDVLLGRARVLDQSGADVTQEYLYGAENTLYLAQATGARTAIFKERSPSCGVEIIYDGSHRGSTSRGSGVTTAKLRENGITVVSEEDYLKALSMDTRPYLGVVGSGECSPKHYKLAQKVGEEIARQGAVLVCGGCGGVMEAASKGARGNGGVVLGILPGKEHGEGNPYLSFSIPTGMGETRNALVARVSEAVIAISGGYGTLSEIALALKMGRPVVGLETWNLKEAGGRLVKAKDAREAVLRALDMLFGKLRKDNWEG